MRPMRSHPQWIGGLLLLLWVLATGAAAQTTTGTFAELQQMLDRDQTDVVTDAHGHETKGRVGHISAASLTLFTPESQTFPRETIREVRRTDRVRDGMNDGFWIGLGAFAVSLMIAEKTSDEFPYGFAYVGFPLFPAVGAVSGLLVDRSMGKDAIYLAPSSRSSMLVSPLPHKKAAGLSVSLEF